MSKCISFNMHIKLIRWNLGLQQPYQNEVCAKDLKLALAHNFNTNNKQLWLEKLHQAQNEDLKSRILDNEISHELVT
jgi:hypothetical protein